MLQGVEKRSDYASAFWLVEDNNAVTFFELKANFIVITQLSAIYIDAQLGV